MKDKGLGVALVFFAFIITMFAGWVMNIINIISNFPGFGDMTGEMVIRIIGVFLVPLGSIMGLFF